jgi:hypothetical protein
MTLNASGPISLGGSTAGQSINLELGQSATAQVSLNDTNVRTLAGVASGAIVMPTNFYGKSAASVNFSDHSVYSGTSSPATAGYRVNSDGFDYENIQGVYTALTQWATPTSVGGNYEVFATLNSGTLTSGTTGSWIATSTNPTWTRSNGVVGTTQLVNMTMQVRATGTATVLDTWTIDLEAERF